MMILEEKNNELIALLSKFLDGQISTDYLKEFAWEVIDWFSIVENNVTCPADKCEKTFWYTIWQIQHLVSEDHLSDKSAYPVLEEALKLLKNQIEFPEEYVGSRPLSE